MYRLGETHSTGEGGGPKIISYLAFEREEKEKEGGGRCVGRGFFFLTRGRGGGHKERGYKY